ncbi:MAG: hypothetical protein ACTSQE_14105, partial [Candidatus Heimdallarchaeaceae archaeon]
AWLSKQMPLFLIIPFFSIIWKRKDLQTAMKNFLRPFLIATFVLSIPWIFITPILYIGRIFAAGHPQFYLLNDPSNNGVAQTLANSILYTGCQWCGDIYWIINLPMIPFIIFYGSSLLIAHFKGKEIGEKETSIVIYTTWSILVTHVFISRGIYKYYNTYINPFLILSSIVLGERIIKRILSRIESENHKVSKNKLSPVYYQLAFLLLFFVILTFSVSLIYFENLWIMFTIRYLHPAILLLVLLFFSLFIPYNYYKSLFVKDNYKELKSDIKEFFRKISSIMKRIGSRIKGKKKKTSEKRN